MKKRSILILSLMLALSIFLSACGSSVSTGGSGSPATGEVLTVRLGHQAPAGTAYDQLAVEFKELVEERTDGRIKIDIYSGGQLGGGRALMESIQVGNLEFAVLTASDMGMFETELEVLDVPYLFEDWDGAFKFLESDVIEDIKALSGNAGMRTLSYMPRGFRHTTNDTRPITVPSDMNGLKLRVAESSVYVDAFTKFGASPQSMAWGEVFTALQQGTIDGQENTLITIQDYKINEVQTYLSETGHTFAFGAISVNPAWIDNLPQEDQDIIIQAATDAADVIGKKQLEDETRIAQELKDAGMIFNEVDKQAFIDLMDPVYDKFFETHDRTYFDAIKEAAAK